MKVEERKPIEEKNSDFEIKADLVIKALGFDPENLPDLFGESNLQVSRWGTIKADFDTRRLQSPVCLQQVILLEALHWLFGQ